MPVKKIRISLPLEINSSFRFFSIITVPRVPENVFRHGILRWSAYDENKREDDKEKRSKFES